MLHHKFDDAFWEEGAGAFYWEFNGDTYPDGQHEMILLVPDAQSPRGFFIVHLYTDRSAGDWNTSGPVHAWNGNIEFPTFEGSILAIQEGFEVWHGYLRNGELVKA